MAIFVPFGGRFPASTRTVSFPAPKAPTYTTCLSTEVELWYLNQYQRAARREITLQEFWWSLIYPPYPQLEPLNAGLRNAFAFASRVGAGGTAFVFQLYQSLVPPRLTVGRCTVPGEVPPFGFDTKFAELPAPPLPFEALPPTTPGAYAYTSEQCQLLARRAFENDYGANHAAIAVLPHNYDVLMGGTYSVQSPTGEWLDYRVVGKEWNFTGNVGTLSVSLVRVAPDVEVVPEYASDLKPPELYFTSCNTPIAEPADETQWLCQNGVCRIANPDFGETGPYTSRAACEAALVPPSFVGGQCSILYRIRISLTNALNPNTLEPATVTTGILTRRGPIGLSNLYTYIGPYAGTAESWGGGLRLHYFNSSGLPATDNVFTNTVTQAGRPIEAMEIEPFDPLDQDICGNAPSQCP